MKKKFYSLLFMALMPWMMRSDDTSFDVTFNSVGYNLDELSNLGDLLASSIGVLSDGSIILAGQAINSSSNQSVIMLASVTSDGATNTDFGTNDKGFVITSLNESSSLSVKSVAIQSDDKIVIAGQITTDNGSAVLVGRYNSDGSVDDTFNPSGAYPGFIIDFQTTGFGTIGNDVQVDQDGNVIVVGNSQSYVFIARYTDQGVLDIDFADGYGYLIFTDYPATATSFVITSDNDYILNLITSSTGLYKLMPLLVDNTGTDQSYFEAINSSSTVQTSSDSLLQVDDKFMMTGTLYSNPQQIFIAQWNTDGTADNFFGINGFSAFSVADAVGLTSFALNVQVDDKILVSANAVIDDVDVIILARFYIDGFPDYTFNDGLSYKVVSYEAGIIGYDTYLIVSDIYNKFLVAGQQVQPGTLPNMILAQFIPMNNDIETGFDLGFNSDGYTTDPSNAYSWYNGVALLSTGEIIAAGALDIWSIVSSYSSSGVYQTFDYENFGHALASANSVAVDSNDKILITGWVANSDYQIVTARYFKDDDDHIFLDTSFNGTGYVVTMSDSPASSTSGNDIIIDSTGKIVISGSYDGDSIVIQRFNENGSLDTTFSSDGILVKTESGRTLLDKAVALYSDNKIATLYYSYPSSGTRDARIYAVNNNGSADTNFSSNGLLVINIDGAQDTMPADFIVRSDNTFLVLGSYATTNATPPYNIFVTCVLSDGSIDTFFGDEGFVYFNCDTIPSATNLVPTALNIFADDKFLVTGYVTVSGQDKMFAARYNFDGSLDDTFSATGYIVEGISSVDTLIYDAVIQEDQKFITVGRYDNTTFLVERFQNFIVYNEPTTVVTTVCEEQNPSTRDIGNTGNGVAMSSTGKITTVGYIAQDHNDFLLLSQYNQDGTFNTDFNSTGSILFGVDSFTQGKALALYGQGDYQDYIFVIGSVQEESDYGSVVARFTSAGILDETFNDGGYDSFDFSTRTTNGGNSVLVYPDNKALALNTSGNGFKLRRYLTNGSLDTSFSSDGILYYEEDGKTLIGSDIVLYTDEDATNNIAVLYAATDSNTDVRIKAFTNSGSSNSNFSSDGLLVLDVPESEDTYPAGIALQQDGQMIVAGTYFEEIDTQPSSIFVTRFDSAGDIDTSFGINGYVTFQLHDSLDLTATAISSYPNGKILVTGYVALGGDPRQQLAFRLHSDGSLDTTFSPYGYIIGDASGVITSQDNVIMQNMQFVTTGMQTIDDTDTIYTSVLNTLSINFELDPNFGENGIAVSSSTIVDGRGTTVCQQSNGKVVVAGSSIDEDLGRSIVILRRYTVEGLVDSSFGVDGIVTTDLGTSSFYIENSAVVPSINNENPNGIYLVGYVDSSQLVISYTQDGQLNTNFNGTGMITSQGAGLIEQLNDVQVLSDGKIVASGRLYNNAISLDVAGMVRYNSNGTLDTTFAGTGYYKYGYAGQGGGFIVQSDGSYLFAIDALDLSDNWNVGYIILTAQGSLSSSYGRAINVTTTRKYLKDIMVAPEGKHVAVGNVNSSLFVCRWLSNGQVDTTFSGDGYVTFQVPDSSVTVASFVQMQSDKILVTGYATINDVNYILFVSFNNSGSLDLTFSSTGYRLIEIPYNSTPIYDGLVQPDLKWIFAGQFTNVGTPDLQGFLISRFLGDYIATSVSTSDTSAMINTYGVESSNIQAFLPVSFYIVTSEVPNQLKNIEQAAIDVAIENFVNQYAGYPNFNFITHLYLLGGFLQTAQAQLMEDYPDYDQEITQLFVRIYRRINQLTPSTAPKL